MSKFSKILLLISLLCIFICFLFYYHFLFPVHKVTSNESTAIDMVVGDALYFHENYQVIYQALSDVDVKSLDFNVDELKKLQGAGRYVVHGPLLDYGFMDDGNYGVAMKSREGMVLAIVAKNEINSVNVTTHPKDKFISLACGDFDGKSFVDCKLYGDYISDVRKSVSDQVKSGLMKGSLDPKLSQLTLLAIALVDASSKRCQPFSGSCIENLYRMEDHGNSDFMRKEISRRKELLKAEGVNFM